LFKRDRIYSWAEIWRVHQTRNGIYQKNERLISLLTDFGQFNACYPDVQTGSGDQIIYTGNGRRGDQALTPGNRAMLAAIKTKQAVPLFNKLAVGRWEFTGFWRVKSGEYIFDSNQKRMVWQFLLVSSKS
jgi:hypothetical protein